VIPITVIFRMTHTHW